MSIRFIVRQEVTCYDGAVDLRREVQLAGVPNRGDWLFGSEGTHDVVDRIEWTSGYLPEIVCNTDSRIDDEFYWDDDDFAGYRRCGVRDMHDGWFGEDWEVEKVRSVWCPILKAWVEPSDYELVFTSL